MKLLSFKKKEQGQVLIIILLVMIVGLTVGLSTIQNTIVDVSTSTSVEEAARAFNAAEAGIEEAIRADITSNTGPIEVTTGTTYEVSVDDLGGSSEVFPGSVNRPTQPGEVFTVWLVPHLSGGGLDERRSQMYGGNVMDVCFTQENPGENPALSMTVFYLDGSGIYRSAYVGYDSIAPGTRSPANNFLEIESSASNCATADYDYRARVRYSTDFGVNVRGGSNVLLALRIQPVYEATTIGIFPIGSDLTKQGDTIESTGKSGSSTRKIIVNEQYVVPAPFLDHAIYSKGSSNISK